MSGNNDKQGLVNQINHIKSKIIFLSEGQHQIRNDILECIQSTKWDTQSYRKVMADIAIHRVSFWKLDNCYIQLHELLEENGNETETYIKEWNIMVREKETLENILDNQLSDYSHEEEPVSYTHLTLPTKRIV